MKKQVAFCALCLALALAILVGAAIPAMSSVRAETKTATAKPTSVTTATPAPAPGDQSSAQVAPDDTTAPDDEAIDDETTDTGDDAVVENPTEEEKFLTDLMADLDVTETNALDKVNGMTHVLLVGIDARPGQKTGRSDTMMLMTIDPDKKTLKLTSFMRDMYVEIPGRKNNRLNSAYVFGGPDLLIKTLKKNFGVTIDYYVSVNFSLLADLIDQIGGLELNIDSKKQMNYINLVIKEDNVVLKKAFPGQGIKTNDNLLTKTGLQMLNGRQAQAYARYRKGSSDFQRTERQREVILKAMEVVEKLPLMDIGKLAMANLDKVDTNMTLSDIMVLAPAALQLKDTEVQQLRIPIDSGYTSKTISGMAVLVPNRAKNVKALTNFLLN